MLRNIVKKKVQRNPQRSMPLFAKEHNVDRESIRRFIKEDLELVLYKLAKGHNLTGQMKASRQDDEIPVPRHPEQDSLHRWKDFHFLTLPELAEPTRDATQGISAYRDGRKGSFPKSVIVWSGIFGLGKTKPVFVPKYAKINERRIRC